MNEGLNNFKNFVVGFLPEYYLSNTDELFELFNKILILLLLKSVLSTIALMFFFNCIQISFLHIFCCVLGR